MSVKVEPHPCWMLTCDRCGEHPDEQEGMTPHYSSESEARAMIGSLDMREAHGWIVCLGCFDGEEQSVPCPKCGAETGQWCAETTALGAMGGPCDERLDAWIAVEKAKSEASAARIAALPLDDDGPSANAEG